ncbi:MAG: phenylacetate--CoA ligase family protein [Actinomycetota bacterium]|nr:AMP-binding protein [Actinomycetota bacterium]
MKEQRRHGFHDEAAETMSPNERRAMQDGMVRGIVEYCYNGSSTYKAKLDEAGLTPADVTGVSDLPKIPVTRKAETQDMKFEGIMTVPYNQARRIFVSPGPQFYAYGPIPQKMNPLLRVYHAIGFRPGDIILNTFTYHFTPAGINFDESLGEFGCAVVPAGPGNTDLQVDVLRKLEVTGYVGTPSFLKIIAEKALDLGVKPKEDFSLECALTTAEPLPEELRAELEDTYGCIVRQLYGSADGLLPCYECWAADGMHVPDLMILEITDPETGNPLPPGEPGAVTATVMNPYRPLLRFNNGDKAMITEETCICGRTAPRLYFKGRIDESTKVRGMFVYPEQIAETLKSFPTVTAWCAIIDHDQGGRDTFTIEVVGEADAATRNAIAEGIRGLVRLRAEIAHVKTIDDPGRLIDKRPV